jgi:CheY-like chemotaxis protein
MVWDLRVKSMFLRYPQGAIRYTRRESDAWRFGAGPDDTGTPACHDSPIGISVLIVDDHAGFRAAARAVLEAAGFEIVGEAGDGATALEQAAALDPDVVLLDIQLPDVDGFAVAEQLAGGPVVVLISTRAESAYRNRLDTTTARGFIPKADLTGPALAAFVA